MEIKISDKTYNVKEARTLEELSKGLQGVESLKEDEGMLFFFDTPLDIWFWMKDTKIPLDIIGINEDLEVTRVAKGNPESLSHINFYLVMYVLEVNLNSGIQVGDVLEFNDEEGPVMSVLFPDGSEQMPLWGGERIISRHETKIIIKKAKKADNSKKDVDYRDLGRYVFKVFYKQDHRLPDYVKSAD